MSYLDTKQALIQQLLTATSALFTVNDVAYENNVFDPSNKTAWLESFFIPATSEATSKDSNTTYDDRGIFQVSVFVKLNSGNYDNNQLQIVDDILRVFKSNSSIVYNNQVVDILDSTVNNGLSSESWFKRDISINYFTFSERI